MSRMQIKIPRDIERRKASPERRGFFRIKDAVTTGVSHHYWEFEVIE